MNHANPVPLLRRLGVDRLRRPAPLDAADFGTEFGMEIYLSQRSGADAGGGAPAGRWWRRLVRQMRWRG